MFRLLAFFCFSCVMISLNSFSQADPSGDVIEKIRKGNPVELGTWLNEMVDLNIPGFKELYSKTQAARIIKDFFSDKPVSMVSVSKEGTASDGSNYTMGSITAGGKKFSLYFLTRKNNGEYRICQLQILNY
ncbi:MAG: DUF4783 domain-containing protein [Bacteroidales bacterium]